MSRKKVAVLMSSYNGEKYIREQIDSILKQKNVDVTLYIRDDNSKDTTINIIKSYISNGNVKIMCDGKNLRPGKSFLKLLCTVISKEKKYDYYAFADQDDIWLDNKLEAAVKMIGETNEPVLYCSNQTIYRNDKSEGMRFTENPDLTLIGHIGRNRISGCTMVMTKQLAEKITEMKKPGDNWLLHRYHDTWVYLIAASIGKVVYDHNSYILYRIHDDNAVGITTLTFSQRFAQIMKGDIKNLRSKTAKYLLNATTNYSITDEEFVKKIADYRNSFIDKLSLILCSKKCKAPHEKTVVFIIKVLVNFI